MPVLQPEAANSAGKQEHMKPDQDMKNENEIHPHTALQGLIEKYRHFPGSRSGNASAFPSVYAELLVLYSTRECRLLLTGPRTQRALFPHCRYNIFSIRFPPGTVPAVSDTRPSELVDTNICPDKIFNIRSDDFCEQFFNRGSIKKKQQFVESVLFNLSRPPKPVNPVYQLSTSLIAANNGMIKITDMADALNVSTRTIERSFTAATGLQPKKFLRIFRFQKILERLKRTHVFRSNTEIAYEFGYTDQSHFIKDFKSMSGTSPEAFRKKERCRIFTIQPA